MLFSHIVIIDWYVSSLCAKSRSKIAVFIDNPYRRMYGTAS
ncbi:hypothetical protein XBFFL1_1830003 [Xenorhabdus bovienii str. feltiae Florida]|nr:hypothetical protein XBFFR1_1920002 [Xenorhabdus bovienii str. feltiae France]CDG91788.1 hypothetical protein XBFFL1_1830003 [Xenorhabdus bovienii str. feltiae Florida]